VPTSTMELITVTQHGRIIHPLALRVRHVAHP
jgi:hypothetical protein